jgi:hypothetical protein
VAGVFDSIWAVANGFVGVGTSCGRMLGLLFQFAHMALFALLAGRMSSVLSAARSKEAVCVVGVVCVYVCVRVCVSVCACVYPWLRVRVFACCVCVGAPLRDCVCCVCVCVCVYACS